MDSSHAQQQETSGEKPDEEATTRAKLEALVTPEQELSASVAKKRRSFTKKRNFHNRRDQTPIKELATADGDDKNTTTTDDEGSVRPKTPERRRRRKTGSVSREKVIAAAKSRSEPDSEQEILINNKVSDADKKDSLTDIAQAEITAFLVKTKKSITAAANRGREKFKKIDKELVKRSRSAPHAFTQEELLESFRKAQLLDPNPPRSVSVRKYSDSSDVISTVSETVPPSPSYWEDRKKLLRPEAQTFLRERRKKKKVVKESPKVVEILNPKTSNILATRTIMIRRPEFGFRQLFSVLRQFSFKELRANYKTFKIDNKKECRRIFGLRNRCLCELFIIMLFCGFGGFIFKYVEGRFENFYKCGVKRVKRDFLDLLWTRSHNLREEDWKSLARNKLRNFEEELHAAHEAGMKTYSGQRAWSFLNAVVYCLTIVTTIGYGHIYPDTAAGQILTIFYAIIGIPLFLLALTDFGKLFTRCIKFLWSFVRRLYYTGSCKQVRKTTHVEEFFKGAQMMYEYATFRRPSTQNDPENPDQPPHPDEEPSHIPNVDEAPTTPAISNFEIDDEFNLPISLAIFLLVSYIFLGSIVYTIWENWNFLQAFYFVFISMSTIGFGDFVPDNAVLMIISIVYLVFGLALTSMCINVVQLKLSDTFKQASTKIGATIGIDVAEEEEEEDEEEGAEGATGVTSEVATQEKSATPDSRVNGKEVLDVDT